MNDYQSWLTSTHQCCVLPSLGYLRGCLLIFSIPTGFWLQEKADISTAWFSSTEMCQYFWHVIQFWKNLLGLCFSGVNQSQQSCRRGRSRQLFLCFAVLFAFLKEFCSFFFWVHRISAELMSIILTATFSTEYLSSSILVTLPEGKILRM